MGMFMVRFRVSTESPVPPSAQLYEQLSFAIASRQLPPGARLPSVRQLSMQTGLHRNTISKVYNQLVDAQLVQARAGSGVYVLDNEHLSEVSTMQNMIRRTIDTALSQGYNLEQIHQILEVEVLRRRYEKVQILVTSADGGTLAMMAQELQEALGVIVQGVLLQELAQKITHTHASVVVTQRYDLAATKHFLQGYFQGEVIPIDVHTYQREIQLVEQLPAGATLGLVSISAGVLRVAEIIIQSIRGQHLLLLTAQIEDDYALNAALKAADLIIADEASHSRIEPLVQRARRERNRPLRLHCAENYIAQESLELLRRYVRTDQTPVASAQ